MRVQSQTYLRKLETKDIPSAMELSSAAGWNQTHADWDFVLSMPSALCLCIEVDGIVAATTTLLCYGSDLAWVGMVLTHADYRSRGFASSLVEHALNYADQQGIRTVKLDATDQGIRVYRRLGFKDEQPIERWTGNGLPGQSPSDFNSLCLEEIKELDRQVLGASRSHLLDALSQRADPISNEQSFIMHRPGRIANYLGPCVATSDVSAEKLIRACLSLRSGLWYWDLLPANKAAVDIAGRCGFAVARKLTRMTRGDQLEEDSSRVFAIAGFEFG